MEHIIYKTAQDCVNLEVSKVRCVTKEELGNGDCAWHGERFLVQEFPAKLWRCPSFTSEMISRAVARRGCSANIYLEYEQFLEGYSHPWWYCYATVYPIFLFNNEEWMCRGTNQQGLISFQRVSSIEFYDREAE